ncbi:hypothetical protein [Ferruginivarius sediminum]|uniref:Uncharacterized protein n=1 Tax=Ferruginivarius sediminum TaxID=2661937 RepID=A0A369T6P9_9PROT|nr:hypothetical protein [Ferruginivarius sediminum]RDD61001.1 hypothetical protein DRB17_14845 [Ferruginivarius sediminum]
MATRADRPWLDEQTLAPTRESVRGILQSAQAFKELSDDERRNIAENMVKVAAYMANPDGLAAKELSPGGGVLKPPTAPVEETAQPAAVETEAAPTARPLRGATDIARRRAAQDPGFAGEDFQAGAVRQGVESFGQLVQTVDFPAFVGGLIENVFQAIVESSIQQMRAYGALLANVAKTVDEFARDNITPNNARDWLSQNYPDTLQIQTGGEDAFGGFGTFAEEGEGDGEGSGGPRLEATGDNPQEQLRRISEELQLQEPVNDLSDERQEQRLVMAARLNMARARQQLLSSMVMLGINRIVVTDGLINAKVIFGLRASDLAQRRSRASMSDIAKQKTEARTSFRYGGWFSPVKASGSIAHTSEHMATVQSSVDETSESRAEVKARLSGEVRVNFKSDYFPMEKLATPQMIAAIQGNAEPLEKPVEDA